MTEQLRQDVCNAVNILMLRGNIMTDSSYAFEVDSRGRDRVLIWREDTAGNFLHPPISVDPLEIITAAGPLGLVRGISDSL